MCKRIVAMGLLMTALTVLVFVGDQAAAEPDANAGATPGESSPSSDLRAKIAEARDARLHALLAEDEEKARQMLERIAEDEAEAERLDDMAQRAKVAAGPNANARLSLDLIPNGGSGNQRNDAVTSGTVSGRGTTIAIEVFATGVTTSLVGMQIGFDFDATLLTFVKAENSAFAFNLPSPTGTDFAATPPVTLPSSGFLTRAEFTTATNVTGREFSIGIASVTLSESSSSSDMLTTTNRIEFNATTARTPDFDGNGTVGFSDFMAFAEKYRSRRGDGRYQVRYDLNGDGAIDFSDFLSFVGSYGGPVSPPGGGNITVDISDANLRAVIADSLGKAPGAPITRSEMATLTRLRAVSSDIRDLTGLEFATSLTYLSLYNNSISNISALSGLTRLDTLSLGNNSISNISALSGLTRLELLVLAGNSISDISALSGLTSLEWLYLYNTSISDISALSGLTRLETLNLSNNSISNISALSGLTRLKTLWLSFNSISDISALSGLTSLEWLALDYNSISDISALSGLTSLERLYLYNTSISDISALSGLTSLELLSLFNNSISNISALSGLTSLEWLWLHNNSISNISALSGLTSLKTLWLSSNSISNISALSGLTRLETLNLYNNSISDISALSGLTSLERLYLSSNSISNISALSGLTSLEKLYLYNNSISDLSPLVANRGLGIGDVDSVFVQSNPLSATSINTHIPALQARGVTVIGGGSSRPDLIVQSPSVSDNTLTTGQSFTLRATVRNSGTGSAAATTLRYYRSSNSTISTSDTEVGTDSVSGLSASATSSESISLRAPSSAGTYYYGACVASVSGESNANNNCSTGVRVTVSSGSGGGGSSRPDLIVQSPSVSDNTLTTGQSFTLRATVRNSGTGRSASTTLRYYRSSNSTISTSDTQVGTDSVSGLSASATSAESISLRAPSSAGTYYYGACVASVSGESNTGNNCSTGVRVTVSSSTPPPPPTGSLGACSVGMVVRPNQSCRISGGEFRNIGSGCFVYTPFGSGTLCTGGFNLNGFRGTRVGNDYRIDAVP